MYADKLWPLSVCIFIKTDTPIVKEKFHEKNRCYVEMESLYILSSLSRTLAQTIDDVLLQRSKVNNGTYRN